MKVMMSVDDDSFAAYAKGFKSVYKLKCEGVCMFVDFIFVVVGLD